MWGIGFSMDGSISHLESLEFRKSYFLAASVVVSCDESCGTQTGITCYCAAIMEKKERKNGGW